MAKILDYDLLPLSAQSQRHTQEPLVVESSATYLVLIVILAAVLPAAIAALVSNPATTSYAGHLFAARDVKACGKGLLHLPLPCASANTLLLADLKDDLFETGKAATYVLVTSTKLTATCILLLTHLLSLNIIFALCTSLIDYVGVQSAIAICRPTDAVTAFTFRS